MSNRLRTHREKSALPPTSFAPAPMEPSARHLAFHGTVVLLFGLLCGGPYARAIKKGAPPHIVQA